MADALDLSTPTTQLDAVNWSLRANGFPPINSLSGVIGRDASAALTWLADATRELCLKGFWFCRRHVSLVPDDNGYLNLPGNCLSIASPNWHDLWREGLFPDPGMRDDWLRLRPVMRQGKVFSVINQTYVWTRPLTILMREAINFEDMPEEARRYLQVLAASYLNGGTLRSPDVDKRLQPLLTLTWDALIDAELENSDHRFL
ncbi:hypothetical protein SAMN02745126_04003 [Enhydrobacter aerosaccus]|uniref:Uncharacterized protein n=1 Tax=Enhydrobacter aerosaccus TaxID=225324 RepID=A0A1T4RPS2_9HYPH|nr:hypothetical protein [Enhydrobacter aerosaccus]SKA17748.1 hypothetical protein SAMN02745126_04003 [Enhydrobacter aerosaccus]